MKQALIVEDMPESQALLCEVAQQAFADVVCHCVASVESACRAISRERYALALVDLGLPDGDGSDVVHALHRQSPECIIVVATVFDDDDHLFPALRAGAQGYLLKDQEPAQLVRQLRGIGEGQPPLSPAVARRLLAHFRPEARPREEEEPLSPREREVLGLLARGVSSSEIASYLGISRYTVGDHVKNIYRKLNISSRAEAALRAHHLGLT